MDGHICLYIYPLYIPPSYGTPIWEPPIYTPYMHPDMGPSLQHGPQP